MSNKDCIKSSQIIIINHPIDTQFNVLESQNQRIERKNFRENITNRHLLVNTQSQFPCM